MAGARTGWLPLLARGRSLERGSGEALRFVQHTEYQYSMNEGYNERRMMSGKYTDHSITIRDLVTETENECGDEHFELNTFLITKHGDYWEEQLGV